VLLPVPLLVGLAKKLFAPLALTVAVAMIASYFVSVCVTRVACRFFLGHAEHGRFGKMIEAFIDRIADRYAAILRSALPFRFSIIAACALLTAGAVWASPRLTSTFFPEIAAS
jgi:multidrug efflux pump subunit AcrB